MSPVFFGLLDIFIVMNEEDQDEPPGGVAVAWPPDTSGGGEDAPNPSPPPAVEYVGPFDAPLGEGVKAGMKVYCAIEMNLEFSFILNQMYTVNYCSKRSGTNALTSLSPGEKVRDREWAKRWKDSAGGSVRRCSWGWLRCSTSSSSAPPSPSCRRASTSGSSNGPYKVSFVENSRVSPSNLCP